MAVKKKQIGVAMNPDLWSRLQEQAADEDISASALLAKTVESYLAKTADEKASITRRIEQARATLNAFKKSSEAAPGTAIHDLAWEMLALAEAMLPGISKMPQLSDENSED